MAGNGEHYLPTFDAPAGGRLTDAMLAAYRHTGVIVLEDFVPVEECRVLQRRAIELVEAFDTADVRTVFSTLDNGHHEDRYFIESGDKIRCFFEPDAFDQGGKLQRPRAHALNKIGHAMHDLDPVFDSFSHRPALAEIAGRIGLREPGVVQSMYIFKPPRIGGTVDWHQDSTYLYTKPESCVGFWFALEDATVENGCLYFIPGAHRHPLKQRHRRLNDYSLTTDIIDDSPWVDDRKVAVEARAGTLVVFDGRAPHYSGPNRSSKSRHAYTLHAIDKVCDYPADNWLQRDESMPLRGFD